MMIRLDFTFLGRRVEAEFKSEPRMQRHGYLITDIPPEFWIEDVKMEPKTMDIR
jgi:hypothetical protein